MSLENVSTEMVTLQVYVLHAVKPSSSMQSPVGNSKMDSVGEKRLYFYPPRCGIWVYEINTTDRLT